MARSRYEKLGGMRGQEDLVKALVTRTLGCIQKLPGYPSPGIACLQELRLVLIPTPIWDTVSPTV